MAIARIDLASDAVVSALVAKLGEDQPSHIRQEIVRALANSPARKAIKALANAILDEDLVLRRYAVISLKLLGRKAKAAAPSLRKLMKIETDPDIRAQAEVALKRMNEQ